MNIETDTTPVAQSSLANTPRHIDELTDDQVAALVDADLERIVRRMMAEQGVPIVPMPVEPEYEPVPGPDLTVYEAAGVMFSQREAAEQVMQAINNSVSVKVRLRYDYVSGYSRPYVESEDDIESVKVKQAYSQQMYADNKAVLERNEAAKRAYDKAMVEYRKADGEAKDIRAEVYGRHAEVMGRLADLDRLAARFREYVQIADGDEYLALRFLRKVEHIADEDLPRVCGGRVPTEPVEGDPVGDGGAS